MVDPRLNTLLSRVHAEHTRIVRALCSEFRPALEQLGLGPRADYAAFRTGIEAALERLLFRSLTEPPYAGMQIQGAQEKREAALVQFFSGLGVPQGTSENYARTLAMLREGYADDGARLPIDGTRDIRRWQAPLRNWTGLILHNAQRVYRHIVEIERDASAPYRGGEQGREQLVDLLRRFPGVADHAYRGAGLTQVHGFPPQVPGVSEGWRDTIPANRMNNDQLFADGIHDQIDSEWWSNAIWAGALAVVAIAVTAVSFGTLSPVAAMLVGAGLGTAQGGLVVLQRSAVVSEARVAADMGLMDPAQLRTLENSLAGAWGMLAVDIATGGVLGRFGGTTVVSSMLRGVPISGAGGGLSAAVDPNVWESPDRLGLILEGVAFGAVTGLAAPVGTAVVPWVRTGLRQRVQIAVDRNGGPLQPGRTVRVSNGRDAQPVDGQIVAVNEQSRVVRVRVGDQEYDVRVERTVELRGRAAEEAPARPPPLVPDPELDRAFLTAADLRRLGVGNQRNGMASEYYTFQTGREDVARHAILRPMAETNVNFGDHRLSLWEGFAPMNYGRWIVVFRADQLPRVVHGNRRPEVEHHGNIDSPGLGYTNFDEARAAGLVHW